jgi:hypothetical protein
MNLANWRGKDEKVIGLSQDSVKVVLPGLKVTRALRWVGAVRWHRNVRIAIAVSGEERKSSNQSVSVMTSS